MLAILLACCVVVGALAILMFATSVSAAPKAPARLLTHLSLVHCPPRASLPAPLTNEERLRSYRALRPAVNANSFPWKHRQRAALHAHPSPAQLRVVPIRQSSRA